MMTVKEWGKLVVITTHPVYSKTKKERQNYNSYKMFSESPIVSGHQPTPKMQSCCLPSNLKLYLQYTCRRIPALGTSKLTSSKAIVNLVFIPHVLQPIHTSSDCIYGFDGNHRLVGVVRLVTEPVTVLMEYSKNVCCFSRRNLECRL